MNDVVSLAPPSIATIMAAIIMAAMLVAKNTIAIWMSKYNGGVVLE